MSEQRTSSTAPTGGARAAREGVAATLDSSGRPEPRWDWQRKARERHSTRIVLQVGVALAGLVVVGVGLALVPLPGPGWLIVLGGIVVWALEFAWAHRLLHFVREKLHAWNEWVMAQPVAIRGLIALGTFALVVLFFWALFAVTSVPTFLPDVVEGHVRRAPGLQG